LAQARAFAEAGARWLHIVDLDGAFAGESRNRAAVEAIVEAAPARIQLGGGIRSLAAIDGWRRVGVDRIVLGTAALHNPALVRAAAIDHPGAIVVAVDGCGGMVATEGWAERSDVPVVDLARRFEDAGVAALLFTDIGRDGLLTGIDLAGTAALAGAVSLPVIASGGLAALDELRALKAIPGVAGVIAGRALYDGRIDLAAALSAARA
jgi:phosphoribosylformimino-5-aminoimidazole carboxamide ribotide isomerase